MQDFTLHTHTIGFDGRNTPAEMIACARDMGFRTIGISNHFTVHPQIKSSKLYQAAAARGYDAIYSASFSEAIDKFAPHYAELEKLGAESDIKVLRGLEVDFFDSPEWHAGFEQAYKILQPDYVIGSAHLVEYNGRLCNMHDIGPAPWVLRRIMLREYWEKVGLAGESGLFTWLAHLDLPKKCRLDDDMMWQSVHQNIVSRIAKSGTPLEINTTPYDDDRDQPYPSRSIMEMVAEHDIPVLISDDAHRADQIGRHFDRAEQFARSCGVKNFMTLQKILDFRKKTL